MHCSLKEQAEYSCGLLEVSVLVVDGCLGLAHSPPAGSDGIIGRGGDDFTDARQTRPTKAKLRGL